MWLPASWSALSCSRWARVASELESACSFLLRFRLKQFILDTVVGLDLVDNGTTFGNYCGHFSSQARAMIHLMQYAVIYLT